MATMVEGRLDEDEALEEPLHRGRVQAQGSGTEKSEAWAQNKPPSELEMLQKSDSLGRQLTPSEAADRAEPFQRLRLYIRSAAQYGGVSAPLKKSFLKRGSRDIRVDLEVITGMACVPDVEGGE